MSAKLTDTHCHLDDKRYKSDLKDIIEDNSLNFILNPGCDVETSNKAIKIAEEFPKVYAAVGIHPIEAHGYNKTKDIATLRELANNSKVLAIGEIGLDYHYEDNPPVEIQKQAFKDQIELARDLNLPFIVHDREAHEDIMNILREYSDVKCVVHAFSGDLEMAQEIIELGNMISVGGPLTFKNSGFLPEVIKEIPLEYVMLETDGPYLTPVPFRGKRNKPSYTRYVANKIAEIKNLSSEQVIETTAENARKFFNVEF